MDIFGSGKASDTHKDQPKNTKTGILFADVWFHIHIDSFHLWIKTMDPFFWIKDYTLQQIRVNLRLLREWAKVL